MADNRVFSSINTPMKMVFFMWLVYFVEVELLNAKLSAYGIEPRTLSGLIGIIMAPFLHGDFYHILSNTFPILFLGGTLYFFYRPVASKVFVQSFFMTGFLVWCFARPSMHIGASGVIYALASFLIFLGIFRKSFLSLIISVSVILFYGGLIYGISPFQYGISWESHLIGGIVGFVLAKQISKQARVSDL